MAWEADVAIARCTMQFPSMFAVRTLLILVAANLAAGCSGSSADAPIDVCDLARSGKKRINDSVTVRAWYGFNYHGSLMGSDRCRNFSIDPDFRPNLRSSFLNPKHSSVGDTRSAFKIGMGGPDDYHADFTGILRKRNTSTAGDPHLPPMDEMPYVLEIDRVDNVRFEQATFWPPPPN
ncbi:hypothetical protein [Sphingopyxis sp. 22461]|uniref:hypothetical protein n=1 Tax=Sphingopyxis sp. 22461 TaxID=3453923 RepID=UPI003F878892